MEKIWNDFQLTKAPFITIKSSHSKWVSELHGRIEIFYSKQGEYEGEFNETAALLGRLMARRKNSFGKMKGFRNVCKLNSALCRLLRLDFKRELDGFRSTLPDVYYKEDTILHLPSRDSFDFLLLRLIGFCELYRRIVECCVQAAEYFLGQLRIQFFFETNTLFLAVIAKIYDLSTKLGNLSIRFYNHMQTYRSHLPLNKNSKFLDRTSAPPLELDIIDNERRMVENTPLKDIPHFDGSSLTDLLKKEKDLTVPVKAKNLKKPDMGKTIERSLNDRTLLAFEQLKTVKDVKAFIDKESKCRNANISSCITKKVLSHEWAGATKLFERKVQNGEEKKAINIFTKFISSKICSSVQDIT
ncbi:uncharacterized protein LOC142235082 [Haematobia irritans]|uniref:uncharacterized protein LOC142235082 n=1 Tax=Haematobia irritans TaxID=7368 RepID=UPI003F501C0D